MPEKKRCQRPVIIVRKKRTRLKILGCSGAVRLDFMDNFVGFDHNFISWRVLNVFFNIKIHYYHFETTLKHPPKTIHMLIMVHSSPLEDQPLT